MPAQPKTPQAPEGTPEGTQAAKDAQVTKGLETNGEREGSPRRTRRNRKPREDRGPRPEHQFLISIHAALTAGVPVETIIPITAFAKRAEGAAAWSMLRKTLDDFTREITGEPEPDEDTVSDEDDEDTDES